MNRLQSRPPTRHVSFIMITWLLGRPMVCKGKRMSMDWLVGGILLSCIRMHGVGAATENNVN
jgi:hypothetical protein